MIAVEIPVAWGEQDALGHVNNAVYFRYCESARIAYMDQLGIGVDLKGGELGAPILARATLDFKRPLSYPDRVRAEARVTRMGNSSLTMTYSIVSLGEQVEVAAGDSVIVWFDYASQKSMPIPQLIRDRIQAIES